MTQKNHSASHPKIAVVLFNLGGPDSRAAIRPFLFNFFMDPNIIPLPKVFRAMIAGFISWRRSGKEAGISYARLGNRSPLLDNTMAQAEALAKVLGDNFKVHVCMRYWHPMSDAVAQIVKDDNPDQIVLLPLYPQFSTATTWSSLGEWQEAAKKLEMDIPTSMICCYPVNSGFIEASAALVRTAYADMSAQAASRGFKAPRVLFSAHGLPEDIIRGGDPYQWQCEKTAAAIAAATGIADLDWQICYQSRVGPKKWLKPATDEALHKAAHDNVPVLIYPSAFVSEHVETLVEIEEEYRELAHKIGVPLFGRVPTVSEHAIFIKGLADMVRQRVGVAGVGPDMIGRICPAGFTKCCMGQGVALEGARACDVASPQVTI